MIVTSFQELMSIAVRHEEEAGKLYQNAAALAPDDRCRQLLAELAAEEFEHGRLLSEIREDDARESAFSLPKTPTVSEFFLPVTLHEGMSFTEVLIYAIKKEENACLFYRELARSAIAPELVPMMNLLAKIEHEHKTKLEEYFQTEVGALI